MVCTWEQKFSFSVPLNWQMSDWTEPLFSPLPYAHVCAPCDDENEFFFKRSQSFHSLSLVKRGFKKGYLLSPQNSPLKTHCSIISFSLTEFHHSFYITLSKAVAQGALLAVKTSLLLQELFE